MAYEQNHDKNLHIGIDQLALFQAACEIWLLKRGLPLNKPKKSFRKKLDHECSLDEIGDTFGVTKQAVRVILNGALTKIKNSDQCDALREFYND